MVKPLFGQRIYKRELNRRDFLRLTCFASAGVAVSGSLVGCVADPVTGEQMLVLMSEDDEIAVDKQQSPHQFSADYGEVQDPQLNAYLTEVGASLATRSHRPQMPYNYRAVNATYVNAYTFPGGSMAATRGILLEMETEAELAALLGHETGHVNARHTAERMSRGMLAQAVVAGAAIVVAASEYADYAGMVSSAGGFGAGALLAKYSRDNEREADALGMEYMTRAGQNPKGMVGLMNMLQNKSKHKPGVIEMMFASHPMSDERYATAVKQADTKYAGYGHKPYGKERYMDNTASLRKIRGAINAMQNGEAAMAQKKYPEAEGEFSAALQQAPEDYAGLVMMAKCQMAQARNTEAQRYLEQARTIYPQEGQALQLNGINKLARNQFESAYQDFAGYEKMLPGNPNTIFMQAATLESMHDKPAAARQYNRFLGSVRQGPQAQYAYQRLLDWGYVK
jgi:predicted Zn-dependent protease